MIDLRRPKMLGTIEFQYAKLVVSLLKTYGPNTKVNGVACLKA